MNKLIFIGVLICWNLAFTRLAAQSTYKIVDAASQMPLPFASVLFTDSCLNLQKASVTNSTGEVPFPSEMNTNCTQILVQYTGYESKEVWAFNQHIIALNSKTNELKTFVVTGEHKKVSSDESVHKVEVISRNEIDAIQAVTLNDVLNYQLNMRVEQDNILGSGLSILGLSGQNVKLLIDGIPVIGRLDGNIDLSQIDLSTIEQIEIIEGPLAVNYGTDALAGTINLITKKSIEKGKHQLSATLYSEQIGRANTGLSIGTTFSKNFTALVNFSRNYFNGWTQTEDTYFEFFSPTLADSSRVHTWKPKEQYNASLFLKGTFSKWNLNSQTIGFYESLMNRGTPRAPFGESAFDDYFNTTRLTQTFSAEFKASSKNLFNWQGAYSYYARVKDSYLKSLVDLSYSPLTHNNDTAIFETLTSRGGWLFTPSNSFSLELAHHFQYDYSKGARISNQLQHLGDFAFFTTANVKLPARIILKPGIRYSYNTAFSAPILPSLNYLQQFKNSSLRASYARGFRAPSLKELYFYFVDVNHNIVGNSNLIAETAHSFSANYKYTLAQKRAVQKFSLSAFYNQLKNRIELAAITNTEYTYVNIGSFTTLGGAFQYEAWLNQFNFQLGVNLIGRENIGFTSERNVARFNYTTSANANLQYTFKKPNFIVNTFYKFNGAQQTIFIENETITQNRLEAYQLLDISIQKAFFKKQFNVSIGVKNILDVSNVALTGNALGGAHSSNSGAQPVGTGRVFFISCTADIGVHPKQNKKYNHEK